MVVAPFSLTILYISIYNTMKAVQVLILALVVVCSQAFAPSPSTARPALKPIAMSKNAEPVSELKEKNAAAVAAFATAMAPFAANAADVDEGTLIGYGAGLVACVVSLAVGFSIGYGTLVKP